MKQYHQYTFENLNTEQKELISGMVSVLDSAGVEERESALLVYTVGEDGSDLVMQDIADMTGTSFMLTLLDDRNWNKLWESSFEPVTVGDFVAVRADFHSPVPGVTQEIIITPKMSFGTGHHATTWLMIQAMHGLSFENKEVFDFGTGTGILAILAEKLGARRVLAIDHDEWSIRNAEENISRNQCDRIDLVAGGQTPDQGQFDIILANINKNILLENMRGLSERCKPGAILLLSGLLTGDEIDIIHSASTQGFKLISQAGRSNWLCLKFSAETPGKNPAK